MIGIKNSRFHRNEDFNVLCFIAVSLQLPIADDLVVAPGKICSIDILIGFPDFSDLCPMNKAYVCAWFYRSARKDWLLIHSWFNLLCAQEGHVTTVTIMPCSILIGGWLPTSPLDAFLVSSEFLPMAMKRSGLWSYKKAQPTEGDSSLCDILGWYLLTSLISTRVDSFLQQSIIQALFPNLGGVSVIVLLASSIKSFIILEPITENKGAERHILCESFLDQAAEKPPLHIFLEFELCMADKEPAQMMRAVSTDFCQIIDCCDCIRVQKALFKPL